MPINHPGTPLLVFATVWLLALGWFDYHYRRLPNSLTMGGAAVLMIWSLALGGWQGLFEAFLGGVAGALCLLPPYRRGWCGAGCVKMMFAAGNLTGFPMILAAVLVAGLSVWIQASRKSQAAMARLPFGAILAVGSWLAAILAVSTGSAPARNFLGGRL